MAAAVVTCTFALMGLGHINPAQAEETTLHSDHQVPGSDGGGDDRLDRGAGAFGGGILAVGLLGNLINHAAIAETDTHARKDCAHIGNCRIPVAHDPGAATTVDVDRRAKAPR
jgi:hypothetical protein